MSDHPISHGGRMYGESPTVTGWAFETDFVLGNSLHHLRPLIKSLSKRKHNVCIIGERGTGKEKVAENYIELSEDKKGWHRINCAVSTEQMLGSELFGHKAGSFTDASKERTGLLASLKPGGGIFLDEIGAAPERFHAALLRVLQERKFYPLGSDEECSLDEDVTILAATSEPDLVRHDVLDRFMRIHIPPLRHRKDEIPYVLHCLWKNSVEKQGGTSVVKKITESALAYLKEYSWPGNVRELKNALESAMILSELTGKPVLNTSSFPTIPMPSGKDSSRDLLIDKLLNAARPLPVESFITGWSTEEDSPNSKSEPNTENKDEIIEQCFKTLDPSAYKKQFYTYYESMGFKAKALLQRFPDIGAESTIRANLAKGTSRT